MPLVEAVFRPSDICSLHDHSIPVNQTTHDQEQAAPAKGSHSAASITCFKSLLEIAVLVVAQLSAADADTRGPVVTAAVTAGGSASVAGGETVTGQRGDCLELCNHTCTSCTCTHSATTLDILHVYKQSATIHVHLARVQTVCNHTYTSCTCTNNLQPHIDILHVYKQSQPEVIVWNSATTHRHLARVQTVAITHRHLARVQTVATRGDYVLHYL